VVTSPADAGGGTLRECIQNAAAGENIKFDPNVFPPTTPVAISLTSGPLPDLDEGNVTIDASDAGVILDGSALLTGDGFHIASDGNRIQGLLISYFPRCGILIDSGSSNNLIGGDTSGERNIIHGNGNRGIVIMGSGTMSNTISGNYIGTDITGTEAISNAAGGITIAGGASHNTVGGAISTPGGACSGGCNLISGNESIGISITGDGTMNNTVRGNYIGTDITGTAVISNTNDGIRITGGASYNIVGGANATPGSACTGECNLISGNGANGIAISNSGTVSNTISGNYVGVDVSGANALPNGPSTGDPGVPLEKGDGVYIRFGASYNVIGGDSTDEGNVLSGNIRHGVLVWYEGTDHNRIVGNLVGTDATGKSAVANGWIGIGVWSGPEDTLVKGNVTSGNRWGISLGNDQPGDAPTRTTLAGNRVGTDAAGAGALGNTFDGITICCGAIYTIIGGSNGSPSGSCVGECNVISGNGGDGVKIEGGDTMSTTIGGNFIGTNIGGTGAVANSGSGVSIAGSQLNVVGPVNTIAYNGANGIVVDGSTALFNTLTRNHIFGNSEKGILLSNGGNLSLPAPVIATMTIDPGIGSTITGRACSSCTVEVFTDDDGEGRRHWGSTMANASGDFTYTGDLRGAYVTATATDATGNTSEFSSPVALMPWRTYLPIVLKDD
jgi:hypothetical protein